jgi:hypothetical protein
MVGTLRRTGFKNHSFTSGLNKKKQNSHTQTFVRVDLHTTGSATTAIVSHYEDGPVIEASTNEKAVKAQLYRSVILF